MKSLVRTSEGAPLTAFCKSALNGRSKLALAVAITLATASASAANFTITAPSTTSQTLSASQTGTITATGSLTVSSGVAVTVSGNDATLTNLGSLRQTGTSRAVRDSAVVSNFLINNGSASNSTALIQTADGDAIQMQFNSGVTLNNYASIISLNASAGGSQAVDFAAITSAPNTINNYFGGLLRASEADAVRPGVNGVVFNAGTILALTSTGSSSDGVDVQSNSGVSITNDTTGLIEGARHGVTGGPATASVLFTTMITNNAGGVIRGDNGSGINLDGFNANQSATIVNHGTIQGNGITGDGDGIDIDGIANITNTGIIRSLNAFSAGAPGFSEGITVGGGTITNSGTIEGLVSPGNTNAVGRGITLAGNDIASGPLAGTREAIYANTVITNQSGGVIRGGSDSGIVVEGPASGFTLAIHNQAGALIQGGGSANAAIRTGADNDTINNAGVIDGSSTGKAIELGAGNDQVHILGGAASVLGDIDGGVGTNTMTIDAGAAGTFAYAGRIANFATVEMLGGEVTLSGQNGYTGTTLVEGGTLRLDGASRLSDASALQLSGGTLELLNAGANAQTFTSFSLTGSSTLDLNASSVTFNGLGEVQGGSQLSVLDFYVASSPDFAFRLLGDQSGNADFLDLIAATTINGLAATFRFDGAYTNVAPVPLPAAWLLLVSGLTLIGWGQKKKVA